MIVVVETNFILQWVFQQEQSAACEELYQLCYRSTGNSLHVPAFAIAEAGMVLERRMSERRNFLENDFKRQVDESRRAKSLQRFIRAIQRARAELVRVEDEEESRWLDLRLRLTEEAQIIPLDNSVLDETVAVQKGREVTQFPDALVFASVRLHLHALRAAAVATPAIFVSTDGAFGEGPVLRQLRKLDCTFVNSFTNAVSRLRSERG